MSTTTISLHSVKRVSGTESKTSLNFSDQDDESSIKIVYTDSEIIRTMFSIICTIFENMKTHRHL